MRPTVITATMVLSAFPAAALEIPIAGAYGSPAACAIYLAGGSNAVFHDGMKDDGTMVEAIPADDAPMILIIPSELFSVEFACTVSGVNGKRIDYECESDAGAQTISATVSEGPSGTLAYVLDGEAQTLTACR